ncbi:hypothetical protein, variant [Sphaeroforma arctica JP610]|uniref:BRCT domain-containing protein n=1 Tax=Sphaeroforma arctica JP610 TaxID=667725 RepID=A0A0L0FQY9_9EUKA|nr:hypothetical protein, variant [Sphaeroforma arctica JP610]KNC79222.1 hypothetical protein, variant [Sphaeroforma arctica JP610]|eukprot:XP_014153124.1 hypothetical protein, variant [Sphaeroforma arctica JP610]
MFCAVLFRRLLKQDLPIGSIILQHPLTHALQHRFLQYLGEPPADKSATLWLVFDSFALDGFSTYVNAAASWEGARVHIFGLSLVLTAPHTGFLPAVAYPVFCGTLRAVTSCSAGLKPDVKVALEAKLRLMGGTSEGQLKHRTTHLITADVLSDKYKVALGGMSYIAFLVVKYKVALGGSKTIVQPSWVGACWTASEHLFLDYISQKSTSDVRKPPRADLDFELLQRTHRLPPFAALVVCAVALDEEERNLIESLVNSNGGQFHRAMSKVAGKTGQFIIKVDGKDQLIKIKTRKEGTAGYAKSGLTESKNSDRGNLVICDSLQGDSALLSANHSAASTLAAPGKCTRERKCTSVDDGSDVSDGVRNSTKDVKPVVRRDKDGKLLSIDEHTHDTDMGPIRSRYKDTVTKETNGDRRYREPSEHVREARRDREKQQYIQRNVEMSRQRDVARERERAQEKEKARVRVKVEQNPKTLETKGMSADMPGLKMDMGAYLEAYDEYADTVVPSQPTNGVTEASARASKRTRTRTEDSSREIVINASERQKNTRTHTHTAVGKHATTGKMAHSARAKSNGPTTYIATHEAAHTEAQADSRHNSAHQASQSETHRDNTHTSTCATTAQPGNQPNWNGPLMSSTPTTPSPLNVRLSVALLSVLANQKALQKAVAVATAASKSREGLMGDDAGTVGHDGLMSHCAVFLIGLSSKSSSRSLIRQCLSRMGASRFVSLNRTVTHVIVAGDFREGTQHDHDHTHAQLTEILAQTRRCAATGGLLGFKMVSLDWLLDSCTRQRLLAEERYEVYMREGVVGNMRRGVAYGERGSVASEYTLAVDIADKQSVRNLENWEEVFPREGTDVEDNYPGMDEELENTRRAAGVGGSRRSRDEGPAVKAVKSEKAAIKVEDLVGEDEPTAVKGEAQDDGYSGDRDPRNKAQTQDTNPTRNQTFSNNPTHNQTIGKNSAAADTTKSAASRDSYSNNIFSKSANASGTHGYNNRDGKRGVGVTGEVEVPLTGGDSTTIHGGCDHTTRSHSGNHGNDKSTDSGSSDKPGQVNGHHSPREETASAKANTTRGTDTQTHSLHSNEGSDSDSSAEDIVQMFAGSVVVLPPGFHSGETELIVESIEERGGDVYLGTQAQGDLTRYLGVCERKSADVLTGFVHLRVWGLGFGISRN